MTEQELAARVHAAIRSVLAPFERLRALDPQPTRETEMGHPRPHLAAFLLGFGIGTPTRRRAELALARWPSATPIELLEATVLELEARDVECRQLADAVGELQEEADSLKVEIDDLKQEIVELEVAKAKKTKASKTSARAARAQEAGKPPQPKGE